MIFTRCIGFIFILFSILNFSLSLNGNIAKAEGEPFAPESQKHLIRGVYYLINQNDLNAAESEFRQAIVLDQRNWEAYYFLGSLYYKRTTFREPTSMETLPASQAQQFIGKAKALLLRAEKLGMTYDKLHIDLLSRLKQEYPKVVPIYEEKLFPKKAKIVIEAESPDFEIKTSKIGEQDAAVIIGTFLPEDEIQLESGASYQLEFLPQKPKSIKYLLLLGIGLTIWVIR